MNSETSQTIENRNRQATIDGLKHCFAEFKRTGIIKAVSPCQCNYYDYLKRIGDLVLSEKEREEILAEAQIKYMLHLETLQMKGEHYHQNKKIADVLRGLIDADAKSVSHYAKQIALLKYFKSIERLEL